MKHARIAGALSVAIAVGLQLDLCIFAFIDSSKPLINHASQENPLSMVGSKTNRNIEIFIRIAYSPKPKIGTRATYPPKQTSLGSRNEFVGKAKCESKVAIVSALSI